MAIPLEFTIPNAADIVAATSGAKIHPQRDVDPAFATASDLSTIPIASGVERYEAWDTAGTSTSWYRHRIEKTDGTPWSDWSTPFQVETPQPITSLANVKQRLGSLTSDTASDDLLTAICGQVDAWVVGYLGFYPGPSPDTTRTFDGRDAVQGGKRLWITDGIRALTLLEVAASTGGSFETVPASDYVLGPRTWEKPGGWPHHYLELVDVATVSVLPYGYANVRMTGLFGWPAVPSDLVEMATTLAVRTFQARQSGQTDVIGTDEVGNPVISRLMSRRDYQTLDRFRWVTV